MNRITRLIPMHEEGCPGGHGGNCDCIVEHPHVHADNALAARRDDLNRHKRPRGSKPSRVASGDLSGFWRR